MYMKFLDSEIIFMFYGINLNKETAMMENTIDCTDLLTAFITINKTVKVTARA